MKKIIDYSELGLILDINLTGGRCACKKTALDNGGKNIYGTNAQFPLNRLITDAEKETVTYTITFNKRVDGVDSLIQTKTVAAGSAIGSITLPTVQGYHFDHWDPSDPTSVIATLNATYTAVYVQDTIQYTLRFFDKNDDLIGSILVPAGTKPTRRLIPSAPEVEGYVFNGWSPYNPWTRTVTENKDFYARYVAGSGDPLEYFTIVSRGTEDIILHISNIISSDMTSYVDVSQINYRVWDGLSKDDADNKIFSSYSNGVWTTDPTATWSTTNIDRSTQTLLWANHIPYTDITVPQVPSGYEVLWKCDANRYAITYQPLCYSYFEIDDAFEIKNNLLTLLYNTDVESLTEEWRSTMSNNSSYCFCGLFRGCTNMTKASNLYFPTTLVGGEHHFSDMFMGCTNLTDAGFTASSGTLIDSAYERMFLGCTSLTKAPKLPSTSVNDHCYQAMFSGCTSLVNAPDLPATTLHYGCYDSMFGEYEYMGVTYSGCTNLTKIKMLGTYPGDGVTPTEWHRYSDVTLNVAHPLRNWVKGIASSGTFTGDNNWPTATSTNDYEGKPW